MILVIFLKEINIEDDEIGYFEKDTKGNWSKLMPNEGFDGNNLEKMGKESISL